jgi:hypothetical protein
MVRDFLKLNWSKSSRMENPGKYVSAIFNSKQLGKKSGKGNYTPPICCRISFFISLGL